jgi:predicted protein tyrosine phosphatase
MKIDVYSRGQAVDLEPTEGTVMISISSPGDQASLKEGWEDILRLEFHDVVRIPKGIGNNILAFNSSHVDAVHKFVDKYAAAGKDFAVHCDAGVSRSVAVGVFLEEVHGGDLHLHAIHTTAAANSRVSRGLFRKYWTKRLGVLNGEDDE